MYTMFLVKHAHTQQCHNALTWLSFTMTVEQLMIVLQWCVVTWLLIAITKNRNCHQQMGMTVFLKSIVYFWCDRKNIGFLKKQKTSFTLLLFFLIKNWTFYWQQQQQQNSNINNSKSKEWRLQKATFNDRFPMPGRENRLSDVSITKINSRDVNEMEIN